VAPTPAAPTPAPAVTPPPAPVAAPNGSQTSSQNSNLTCLQTDDTNDYYTKGSVQYNRGNVSLTKTDECLGTSLRDWYCDSTGELQKQIIECTNGCADGACRK
jgi:hypothetical protein